MPPRKRKRNGVAPSVPAAPPEAAKPPQTYSLDALHGRPGDDLAQYLDGRSVTAAFRAWARSLRRAAQEADQVAETLRRLDVDVQASGNFVDFTTHDARGTAALEKLVCAGLAIRTMIDASFDDCPHCGSDNWCGDDDAEASAICRDCGESVG